jgi:hypothetical protein
VATNVVITTDRNVGLKNSAAQKRLIKALQICIGTAVEDAVITVEFRKKGK